MSFELISTVTVGSGGAASIDFTSIPQTYTDLVVKISGRSTTTDQYALVTFNGSSSNLSGRYLFGNGSSASSGSFNAYIYTTPSDKTTNTFGSGEIYLPNYAGSSNKSSTIDSIWESNDSGNGMTLHAGLWSNTAAITRVTATMTGTGLFAQYSTASLYGILKGSGGATVS